MKNWFWFIILVLFSCNSNEIIEENSETTEKPILSFIAAGHVYGNSDTYTESVYPPFLAKLKTFIPHHNLDYIILTGDVVAHPTSENWETVKREMDSIGIPWHIAPGNHDVGEFMSEQIQAEDYLSIEKNGNILVIMNTCYPGWSIDSTQSLFIKETLNNVDTVKNIFAFSHQLWWLKNRPEHMALDSLRPNSFALWDGNSSFWETGFDHFKELNKPTYFFAGDMGCYYGLEGYYEDHFENYHFYGSGMGGAVADNFLFVEVFEDASVKITRIDF